MELLLKIIIRNSHIRMVHISNQELSGLGKTQKPGTLRARRLQLLSPKLVPDQKLSLKRPYFYKACQKNYSLYVVSC